MDHPRILRLLLITALCLGGLHCAKRQTITQPQADFTVAADGSTDYETISEALDEAKDGDVILVKPGTYEEEVEFDDDLSNVTLLGSGPDQTVIDADGEYAGVTLRGNGHRISGFTIRGAGSHGVYIPEGRHRIDHCLIIDNSDRGIYLSTMTGQGRAEIDHCTIADNKVSGIYSVKDDAETAVSNSIIAYNGRGIVTDKNEHGIRITRTCVSNQSSNFDRVDTGEGNITLDPLFRDRGNGDYRLAKGSPCLGTAARGANMGCFK